MKYFNCGYGDEVFQISRLGIGTIGAGSRETATEISIKDTLNSFSLALDLGANFFDVGEDYEGGFTEEVLGQFAKRQRNKLILATKFTPKNAGYKDLLRAAEGSLRRLQTDYIDIYQMHWPNNSIPLYETIAALEKLLHEGKVRSIGLSNCSIKYTKRVNSLLSEARVVTNQVKFNPYSRPTVSEPNYFSDSICEHLTTIAYGIFGQGKLKIGVQARFLISQLCQKYQIKEPQLLIAWVLSFPTTVAMVRSKNPDHIMDNFMATDLVIAHEDLERLTSYFNVTVHKIPVNRILIQNRDPDVSHKIYISLDEAMRNEYELFPNLYSIANEIEAGDSFIPVELIPDGQNYQLVQGRMRYWAWRYLYGVDSLIPAVIIADTN